MSSSVLDICIASDWEYDRGFTDRLERALQSAGRTTFVVWPHNLYDTLERIRCGELAFHYLYDRASNTSCEFLEIHRLLENGLVGCLDDPRKMIRASDKAVMHAELLRANVPVPRARIIPAFDAAHEPCLAPGDLAAFGRPFVVKPTVSAGGGLGVVEACELEEVLAARRQYPQVRYLIQEKVVPMMREGLRFWFRIFYVCGSVIATWWDDRTHVYRPVSESELVEHRLDGVVEIVRRIASASGLRFFSTEIVRDVAGRLLVVDYINETCDMRCQSVCADGVPDAVIEKAVSRLAAVVLGELAGRPASTGSGESGRSGPIGPTS